MDTISTVLCVCEQEREDDERKKVHFFILLGCFVFVSENKRGKKEPGL